MVSILIEEQIRLWYRSGFSLSDIMLRLDKLNLKHISRADVWNISHPMSSAEQKRRRQHQFPSLFD